MVVASKTLIDRVALRIDRLETALNPPPPKKCVVVLQFDDETDEDMRRKHAGYDLRTSLHLGFDDYVRTDWPVAEEREKPIPNNADVPRSSDQTIDDYLSRGYSA
jgi:hypothetical protein